MSIREEQCNKVCRILDDVLANRPTERDSLIVAVRKAFEALGVFGNSEQLPSADVVPVVHGVWRNGYRVQTCSVCKGTGKKSWKFCPYCGAKMDGERKE